MILLRGVDKPLRVGSRLCHMYKQITGLAIQIGADGIQLAQSFKTRQTSRRRLG